MFLVLTEQDLTRLKPATRQDLQSVLGRAASQGPQHPPGGESMDWVDVIDLSADLVDEFMRGCARETIAGLKVIAEHGPKIHASLLDGAGITNYGHFQGRVTKRTRTVTHNPDAYLFAWDDWSTPENKAKGGGHYMVTDVTHQTLRGYFRLRTVVSQVKERVAPSP